jgi:hypothetical protein
MGNIDISLRCEDARQERQIRCTLIFLIEGRQLGEFFIHSRNCGGRGWRVSQYFASVAELNPPLSATRYNRPRPERELVFSLTHNSVVLRGCAIHDTVNTVYLATIEIINLYTVSVSVSTCLEPLDLFFSNLALALALAHSYSCGSPWCRTLPGDPASKYCRVAPITSYLGISPLYNLFPMDFSRPRQLPTPPETDTDYLAGGHHNTDQNTSSVHVADLDMNPHPFMGTPSRRVSTLAYHSSPLRDPRERVGIRHPRWLVVVIPPTSLVEEHGPLGHTLTSGPSQRLSQGILMPLLPTVSWKLSLTYVLLNCVYA